MNIKPVLQFFEYINKKQFHKRYIGGSYTYLMEYLQGVHPRTNSMDEKIQQAILDYHDDTFGLIENITKKKKGK